VQGLAARPVVGLDFAKQEDELSMGTNATAIVRQQTDTCVWRHARSVLVVAVIVFSCVAPVLAQTGSPGTDPPSTNIDVIVEQLRNFIITVLMPLIAALAIVWACFQLYSGGREGMGNMLKVVGATLAALGAVGLVELLKAFAGGQPGR
jgi:hypothetical protein